VEAHAAFCVLESGGAETGLCSVPSSGSQILLPTGSGQQHVCQGHLMELRDRLPSSIARRLTTSLPVHDGMEQGCFTEAISSLSSL
ncbi:hypothetical protein DPEC_G00374190, partial [Dallia pectoralis]